MWNAGNNIFLLTLSIILLYFGLIYSTAHSSDLRASNDAGSDVSDLNEQSLMIEFDDTMNISNNTEDSVYGQVRRL